VGVFHCPSDLTKERSRKTTIQRMREKSHWSDEIRNEKTRKIETNRRKKRDRGEF